MVPNHQLLLYLFNRLRQAANGMPPLDHLEQTTQSLLTAFWHADKVPRVNGYAGLLLEEMRKRPLTDLIGPLYTFTAERLGGSRSPGDRLFRPQSLTDITAALAASKEPWNEQPRGTIHLVVRGSGTGTYALSIMKAVAREAPPADLRRIQIVTVDPDPVSATITGAQLAWHRRWFVPAIGVAVFRGDPHVPAATWSPVVVRPCGAVKVEASHRPPAPSGPPVQLELGL